jgi:hypothetical protein
MYRYILAFLCLISVLIPQGKGQKSVVAPLTVPVGTVLTFHLQTRLNPTVGNQMDVLPRGTALRVRLLNNVDSGVDRDGSEFRGEIVTPVLSGTETVLHSDAQVRGLLALLRSRNHPEGFRYELLITNVSDHGKSYALTASLNSSFADGAATQQSTIKPEESKGLK